MFSDKMIKKLEKSSWIRAMFEEGDRLRKIYGSENVFDFSIGNPEIEPPATLKKHLQKIASSDEKGMHRYMSNAGYDYVREKIAGAVSRDSSVSIDKNNIVMTCGAAGGLNVSLKSIINPGEEVIVFSPFFVEYLSYIENHGGTPVVVSTDLNTFEPDIERLSAAINKRTKAIIINSPNNPTGVVYSQTILNEMSRLINSREKEYNTSIFVLSDQPYDKIVYDNIEVPSVLKTFKNSIVVNSFSKSLALPGERIGYIAVNPSIDNVDKLMNCLVMCNRILGFVNAPALIQRLAAKSIDESVSVNEYKKRRDILYDHLIKLGFSCIKPQGTFYLFPKSLIADDVKFVKQAQKYNLLLVPGSGFGCPGYIRLSFCINLKTIMNSLPAFEKLAEEFNNK